MIKLRQQRGAALFVGIFLITVVVVFAAVVALTSSTQHLSQARAGLAEQAWYTAIACLEDATQKVVRNKACPVTCDVPGNGYDITLDCPPPESVTEGSNPYEVYNLRVSAQQGNINSAVFVRRSAAAQVIAKGSP